MAKADTITSEEKPKKRARKSPDEDAVAAGDAQAEAASKKTDSRTGKIIAASGATAGASDIAEPRGTSTASQPGNAQDSGDQAQESAPNPDATEATTSMASSGAVAGSTLDPALLPAQRGKVGVFGGPKDRGIKPDDKLALPTGRHFTFERVRSLNPKGFYCAMRWDYHALGKSKEEGKRWWANKKLLVTNPTNGLSIVVRAVDDGPPESTGLTIGLSPGAAEALGVAIGDEVEIAFADPRQPAGVVE